MGGEDRAWRTYNDSVLENIRIGLQERTPSGSFDENKGILEILLEIFGTPPDVDGNGKVEFLLTDIEDGWDGQGSYIGGYFTPSDQTTYGNGADILYVDTYPGIYSEKDGISSYDESSALGTISHELQHLIHFAYDADGG